MDSILHMFFLACNGAGFGGTIGTISGQSCTGERGKKMVCTSELLLSLLSSHYFISL